MWVWEGWGSSLASRMGTGSPDTGVSFQRSHGILLGVVGSDVALRELMKLAPRYKVSLDQPPSGAIGPPRSHFSRLRSLPADSVAETRAGTESAFLLLMPPPQTLHP